MFKLLIEIMMMRMVNWLSRGSDILLDLLLLKMGIGMRMRMGAAINKLILMIELLVISLMMTR